jgi:Mn2+/Fe2+ NRAMP family transporter
MIKIATILSFLTAPFYAIANYLLVTSKHMPIEYHPSTSLKILSYFGIVFLIGFSIWYLMNL